MKPRTRVLRQLLKITGTGEFEDNGRLLLESATWFENSLDLRFRVEHGTDETSTWTLHCSEVIDYFLTDVRYQIGLNVRSGDHPLIKQYVQPLEGLYSSKRAADPDCVVGQLWDAHARLVDDWIPFDRYLRMPLRGLLSSGQALVATAPAFLADIYSQVLESNGCEPTRLPALPARAVSAQLAHFGDSYALAARITASRSPD